MAVATLRNLFTFKELESFEQYKKINLISENLSVDTRIENLRVKDLGSIALIVMKEEYGLMVPACLLSAECINIFVRRAQKQNLSILD